MPENNITDAAKYVVEDKLPQKIAATAEENANVVLLDPSTPSIRSITRVVVVTLVILFVSNAVQGIFTSLTYLFFLIVLSVFFAYLIEPLVQMIRQPFENANREKYMPRTLAIAAAYLLVFLVIGGLITVLTPIVVAQAKQFTVNLPNYTASIQQKFSDYSNRYESYKVPDAVQEQITGKAGEVVGMVSAQVGNFLIAAVSYLPWLILVPVLAFFFLKDANLFRVSVLRIFPSGDWRARIELFLHDVNRTLAAYVRAQIISCLLIGSICTLGFYFIGVKYALLLGVMAGFFEFVPLIGPLTIAVVVITVAAFESPTEAVVVLVFLAVLRILQDYIFYPRIVRGGIHLHPLAIILSVLAGEQLAGIPGVFLSIPVVAIITVIYKHVLEHSRSKGIVADILAPKDLSEDAPQ